MHEEKDSQVNIRMPEALYDRVTDEARRVSQDVGTEITWSAMARVLLDEALTQRARARRA